MYLVTSFGFGGWEHYARKNVETFVEFWPNDCHLFVGYHDAERPAFDHPRVTFFNLLDDPALVAFKQQFATINGQTPEGYNYRFDALKFSHKVFAIVKAAELAQAAGAAGITWVDGDTFTFKPVDTATLQGRPNFDIHYLGRTAINYAETSYIRFNFTEATAKFIRDLLSFYINGTFLNHREFHDGWLFSRLLETSNIKALNLTPEVSDLDAFSVAPIGAFMTHLKGGLKGAPLAPGLIPLKVQPRDCMPDDYTAEHIKTNTAKFKHMILHCWPHSRKAIICGAGPSLSENFDAIKAEVDRDSFIVCVKHSYPLLREAGIVPDACVILDPRPFDEKSTHLKKRRSLLDLADGNTTFYIASMTNVEYLPYLEQKGVPVVGWHAMTKALQLSGVPVTMAIAGGTCSVIRALAVCHTMGFRRFHFYGVDASVPAIPVEERGRRDDAGRPWWIEVSPDTDGKRKFFSTGEMVALCQDIEHLAKQLPQLDSQIELTSPLLAGAVWDKVKPKLNRMEFDAWELS